MFLHQPHNKNQHVTCIRQREQLKRRCLYVTENTTGNEEKTHRNTEKEQRGQMSQTQPNASCEIINSCRLKIENSLYKINQT